MDVTLRALNRFGLGARRGERRRIADARLWLRAQLDGGLPSLRAPDAASPGAIGDAVRGLRILGQGTDQERREARRRLVELGAAEVGAALTARVTSDRPFVERLVAFWSNHLCVSTGAKILVAPLAGSYERDVIRPHVLGRFEDMVLASARHPAMLVYLDNFQSSGPASRGARAGQRTTGARRGLNENYARELMELHTLGVNGGYTQQDVQELARILTGWTIDGLGGPGARNLRRAIQPRAGAVRGGRGQALASPPVSGSPIAFLFQDLLHEPGSKTVLGERYNEAGVEEGERAIRALCRHPSTAQFVATKLVAHFVSDAPPAAAVERVARVFRSSDGDLKVVARALVDEPEAWREEARKFRTPQDWFVAVLRAVGATELKLGATVATELKLGATVETELKLGATVENQVSPNAPVVLRQLRQPFWSPPSPKGFGDAMQEWADPDSLLNRAELARTIAALPGLRTLDPRSLAEVVDVAAGNPLHTLLADASIPSSERVALAIAGPAFQWR